VHWLCLEVGWAALCSTELDFVEAPSQMLEWWLYDPQVLQFLSNYQIPSDTANKLKSEKIRFSAYTTSRNLAQTLFDHKMHSATVCPDFESIWISSFRHVLGIEMTEMEGGYCSFTHMFGQYAGAFYSYLYSQVFAGVIFAFLKDNSETLLNCGDLGFRYRKGILSQGLKRPSIESLLIFLGEKPTLESYVKINGWNKE
jgi:Zn-dependent oligopeptidase